MQLSFGIENMRRIRRMPLVPLKPITLLVGRNSAGKSTFLRTLPLIRQSLQTRTSAPILWFGDLIDMGDFKTTLNKSGGAKEIAINFHLDEVLVDRRIQRRFRRSFSDRSRSFGDVSVSFRVGAKDDVSTVLNSIQVEVGRPRMSVELNFSSTSSSQTSMRHAHSFILNGEAVEEFGDKIDFFIDPSNLFSEIEAYSGYEESVKRSVRPRPLVFELRDAVISELKRIPGRSVGKDTLNNTASALLEYAELDRAALSDIARRQGTKTLTRFFQSLIDDPESAALARLSKIVALAAFFELYDNLAAQLQPIFLNSRYIGPARARGERYYRLQELEVSEIDPDGQNFPMFLRSLTQRQRESFSSWVKDAFGYGVETSAREGHVSIQLVREDNTRINIADAGYGISQILPVLGAVWWGANERRRRHDPFMRHLHSIANFIAIEQPELHLHPAHQARLADTFVSALSAKQRFKDETRFLIETHSESLINRLGELVEQKKISADDIAIVVFEGSDGEGTQDANIRMAHYNSEGYLEDWPHGFFSYAR